MRVYEGAANAHEVADLSLDTAAEQIGIVAAGGGAVTAHVFKRVGCADARHQQGRLIVIRSHVDLHAVETWFGEGHWRQGGADLVADGDGVVVLAFAVGGNDDLVEPLAEAAVLE